MSSRPLISGRRRDAIDPEHDRLGVTGWIAEPVRAAACEAEAVAVLERPAFGIDGELHFALDHEARLFAVMRIEFVAGASAGLHMDQKQIEAAFRSGRTEQLLGDAGAPQVQLGALALTGHDGIRRRGVVLLGAEQARSEEHTSEL